MDFNCFTISTEGLGVCVWGGEGRGVIKDISSDVTGTVGDSSLLWRCWKRLNGGTVAADSSSGCSLHRLMQEELQQD